MIKQIFTAVNTGAAPSAHSCDTCTRPVGANTPPPPPPGLVNRQIALTELFLLPNAPADVITAVFRVLAKKYHPDMGGSTEKMQRLNAAMEVLK